jgi:hypothetical protein
MIYIQAGTSYLPISVYSQSRTEFCTRRPSLRDKNEKQFPAQIKDAPNETNCVRLYAHSNVLAMVATDL